MMKKLDGKKRVISEELIRRGKIDHLLSTPQKAFYSLVMDPRKVNVGFYGSRKMGKSFSLLLILFNEAQQRPGIIVRVVLPMLKMVADVYEPIINELKSIIPKDIFPHYMRSEKKLVFKNGSIIKFGGAAKDQLDSNRGPRAHIVCVDEAPAVDSAVFHELIYGILKPQQTTVPNPKFIYTGTPPRTTDHYFVKNIYPQLMAEGSLHVATIDDNDLLSDDMKQKIAEDYGGRDSEMFRREYLCELLSDRNALVIPEFDEELHTLETMPELVDNFGNPANFWASEAMDVGLVDNTAIIAGYYNHYEDKLVITHEYINNQLTMTEIADAWYEAQSKFVGPRFSHVDGVVDVFDVAGFTLRHEHGMGFRRPRKSKVEETISFLRNCFAQDKILILKNNCPGLVAELQVATWKESESKARDLDRSEEHGHYDAVMALAYLAREVPWGRGPGLTSGLKFAKIAESKKPQPSAHPGMNWSFDETD